MKGGEHYRYLAAHDKDFGDFLLSVVPHTEQADVVKAALDYFAHVKHDPDGFEEAVGKIKPELLDKEIMDTATDVWGSWKLSLWIDILKKDLKAFQGRFIGHYFNSGLLAAHQNITLILKEDGSYSLVESFPERDGVMQPDGSMVMDGYGDNGRWFFNGVSVILKSTSGKRIQLSPEDVDGEITLSDKSSLCFYITKARQVGPNSYEVE